MSCEPAASEAPTQLLGWPLLSHSWGTRHLDVSGQRSGVGRSGVQVLIARSFSQPSRSADHAEAAFINRLGFSFEPVSHGAFTVKQAWARSVELRLEWADRGIMLEIGDDGRGFKPEGEFPGHLGLKTMRERATQHQGTFEVDSSPSEGTRIRAWLPVASPVS